MLVWIDFNEYTVTKFASSSPLAASAGFGIGPGGVAWGWCLLLACLGGLASLGLWWQQQHALESLAQERFQQKAQLAVGQVEQRTRRFADVLQGLSHAFALQPHLRRAEFEQMAQSLELGKLPTGVLNIHFVRHVPATQRLAFEERTRQDPHQDGQLPWNFAIHPEQASPAYNVVEYFWPLEGNRNIIGLNINSQPVNLEALQHAQRSRALTVSAPFMLAQQVEQDPSGLILRRPLWDGAAFLGAVGLSVHLPTVLHSLQEQGYLEGLVWRIVDLGWSHAPQEPGQVLVERLGAVFYPQMQWLQELDFGGRRWQVVAQPAQCFLSSTERAQPWMLLGAGLVLTGLLCGLGWLWGRQRQQFWISDSVGRMRSVLDHMPVGVSMIRKGQFVFRNAQHVQICGYDQKLVSDVDSWWRKVIPDPQHSELIQQRWRAAYRQARQHADGVIAPVAFTLTDRSGQQRSVELSGKRIAGGGHVVIMQDVTERQDAEEEIRRLAYFDGLTSLPNRRLLLDRMAQAMVLSQRHQRWGAVLLLDLDHFKTVNDSLGPEQGDRLLQAVAGRLRSCIRQEDTLARLGGDEFVLLLTDLANNQEDAALQAEEVGEEVLAAMRQGFSLEQEHLQHMGGSIGMSLFLGQQASAETLLQQCDIAMYQAKAAGRNTMRFYDPQMQVTVAERMRLETDMRSGLEQSQFVLYFQPQMRKGQIVGAEALLRWQHPDKGFVSPVQFIPLAEETGLILPLGRWVLQQACQTLAQWAQQPLLAQLTVAVNVSPRQFREASFIPEVLAALASTGARAELLKLEITEGMLLDNLQDTIDKMVQLRGYGVGFSLDDFGTGYSSLAYLKRLPLQELKIDQSFVRDVLTDPNDAAIARTIVALGHSLGLQVTAEGVETEEILQFLEGEGCFAWQGYLMSPPVPVQKFEALVENKQARQVEA